MAVRWLLPLLLAGCVSAAADAGCMTYGAQRAQMPRPVPDDALGRWVAVTDAAMTGACR